MKTYRGSPAGARNYVEAGRSRVDDYYLGEGTGIAERYAVLPTDGVRRLAPLTGDAYEAWVAGVDPVTGEPKGRLRNDENAVRFVEVVVNGPKSWSLAAELHPGISAAYDAAQDRAARQILGWLACHATTRVGPRGGQVQVPVTELEAAVVRHYTSRAGDPHRHLHLQINARVLAEGRWRGLHTVGVRDSLDAINGIGHAAVMTDPGFRTVLATHGYTLNSDTGEISQLADFVGPFSARAAQIGRNIDRYETQWRAANPGREPGPALLRAWDARGWADARPDKIVPSDGADLGRRWRAELHNLGFRPPSEPVPLRTLSVGRIDREHAVEQVLTRLASRRSAWNTADIHGEVEQLIARAGVVTAAPVRSELAEDLTARTLTRCVPLLARTGVPEHIRALTSPQVLEVEADLVTRLAARGNAPSITRAVTATDQSGSLDVAQQHAVAVLAGDAQLVVVEGAAGAGKTATLAAARAAIDRDGHRLVVVTPTRKAAQVAARELGTPAFSAAWLAHQHGYRWDGHSAWSRLAPGQVDRETGTVYTGPSGTAMLHRGDCLLVDEAGMLDQDTAHALLTIADGHGVRLALVGDRHQLPAVGRGGVLDHAVRWAHCDAQSTLDTVHRFVHTATSPDGTTSTAPDDEYGRLSLTMRTGDDAGDVFDALVARGHIQLHASDRERLAALADTTADAVAGAVRTGSREVVVADTREQVAALNAAIRDRLVESGQVDDNRAMTTAAGVRIGVGDRVATRRNDTTARVANRDTWTVTHLEEDGSAVISGQRGDRVLPAQYVREHVELAYASTVHGVQGDTVTAGHLLMGEHTSAAAAYVGMTRGREHNTAHLVADTVADARDQWIAAFSRDRADLGPARAAHLAAAEAERYARLRPLDQVLDELRQAWTTEAAAQSRLDDARQSRELLRDIVTLTQYRDADLPPLRRAHDEARLTAQSTAETLRRLERAMTAHADEQAMTLQAAWDAQRQGARDAAQTVRHGTGRLGQRRAAVRHAYADLDEWSTAWGPYVPAMPAELDQVVAFASWFDDTPCHHEAIRTHARAIIEQAHPHYLAVRAAAQQAADAKTATWTALRQTEQHYSIALQHHGSLGHVEDPDQRLADTEAAIAADDATLATVRARISALRAEPTLRTQRGDVVEQARTEWATDRDHLAAWRNLMAAARQDRERDQIGPRSAGRGGEIEISRDAPDRGISR